MNSITCYSCAIGKTIEAEKHTDTCGCYATAVITGVAIMISSIKSHESPLFCSACMTSLQRIMIGLGHELTTEDVVKVGPSSATGGAN